MKSKLVREYIELPAKSKDQILSDMKLLSQEQLNKTLFNVCNENPIDKSKVEMLLSGGADVNAKNRDGWTALMWASWYGHKDVVSLLLANGADVNAKDSNGRTALMWASINGHKDVVSLLIANGADVNAKDKWGQTALMLASYRGHKDIVELLRKYGAKE